MYAINNTLSVSGAVTATVEANAIASVWRNDVAENESVLYLNESELYLDLTITKERNVMAYCTSSADIEWSIVSGSETVGLRKIASGAVVTAKAGGVAVIEARCGNAVKQVRVSVHSGTADSDLNFTADNIVSGRWYVTDDGIVGEMASGDGYILSDETGRDFALSATFRLEAVAAAMILRAKSDMSDYIIVNYDNNAKLVKVWSANGQIGSAPVGNIDTSSVTIRSKLTGDELTVYLNGEQKLSVVLSENEPKEGRFGLNVFSGKASFASIAFVREEYDHEGEDLVVFGDADQAIRRLYNLTLRNVKINPEYYHCDGRKLVISDKYFENLSVGVYSFKAEGAKTSYTFTVNVTTVCETVISDVRVSSGLGATIYVGNVGVSRVSVNGKELASNQYVYKNKVLYINKEALTDGENVVVINGNKTVKVTVVR